MKPLVICMLFLISRAAFAVDGMGCEKPEYAQLKGADKAELRTEYCRMKQQAKSYDWSHENVQKTISNKTELQLDTLADRDRSLEYLKAANSCKIAATYFSEALSKRFKSKPPLSCD